MLLRSTAVALVTAAGAVAPADAQIRLENNGLTGGLAVMTWRDIPFRSVVRQQHDFSCGSAALATLLTHQYGMPTSEADAFRRMYADGDQEKIRKVGFSMLDMKKYLDARGLSANGYRLDLKTLARDRTPAIALVTVGRYKHFVVIKGVVGNKVLVGDPALGLKTWPATDFLKIWNGVAFVINRSRRTASPTFNLASDWRPWSRAPMGDRAETITAAELGRNLAPIYQLTPMLNIPGAPAPGG